MAATAQKTTAKSEALNGASTVALEENRGLAARLVELRADLEARDQAQSKALAEMRSHLGRIEDRHKALNTKLDQAKTEWDRDLRAIQEQKRAMDEDVRRSGELARKMTDHMAVLDELRESQPDLDQMLGPIKRSIQQVALDLESYKKNQDTKWEPVQKILGNQQRRPAETRDGDEALQRVGEKMRKLEKRVEDLEGS